jgi:hypothetical protein
VHCGYLLVTRQLAQAKRLRAALQFHLSCLY